jgi:Zn-finger nucleic acid-binding protein
MNLQNFARYSGVIVDVCKAHGIWFDSGELGAVVRFVKSGGMEKARRKEIEQAQRELEIKKAYLPSSDQEQCTWIQECNSPSLFGRALQIMIKAFFPKMH